MPDFVDSLVFLLIGALLGATMSYIASYRLQLSRWRADAALLRKEKIYGPIFDELKLKESMLSDFRVWMRRSSFLRFQEWDKHCNTSLGLLVPDPLRKMFEALTDLCRLHNEASAALTDYLQASFTDKHNDVDDWVVAMLMADKMLIAPDARNRLVLEHLMDQRPTLGDIDSHWTESRLKELAASVFELPVLVDLAGIHEDYSTHVHQVRIDVQGRIEGIVRRYQTASKRQ